MRRVLVGKATVAAFLLAGMLYVRHELRESEELLFGGGPNRAELVDEPVGLLDLDDLGLSGDLILRSLHGLGLGVQPLSDPAVEPMLLFPAQSVTALSPNARYAVSWDTGRWRIIRLSDLRAVADVSGSEPFFVDADRVLVVFEGRRCTRREAVVLDLVARTRHVLEFHGDDARLHPVAFDGADVVAQRLVPGDSSCAASGVSVLDLGTGIVRTLATRGFVLATAPEHIWLRDGDHLTVLSQNGDVTSTGPPVTAFAVGDRVVYARETWGVYPPPTEPTALRLAAETGPASDDRAGAALVQPELLSATVDGESVIVAHRGDDLPDGTRTTLVSRCRVQELTCTPLLPPTRGLSHDTWVVPNRVLAT